MDWVITLPQKIEWSDYQKELDAVVDWNSVIKYRVRYIPKDMKIGDRMFIVWRGRIRGWMQIVGIAWSNGFTCKITNKNWLPGYYIDRSGVFHRVNGPEMKGFRGIRRYHQ